MYSHRRCRVRRGPDSGKTRAWRVAWLLGTQLALLTLSPLPAAAGEKARMADFAADLVGVNTHINYRGTVYDTKFDAIVRPRLLELGVRHIRDNPGEPDDAAVKRRFIDLARDGVRTLMINWPERGSGRDYVEDLNERSGIRVVEAVEPPNERDTSWRWFDFGPRWAQRMRAFMSDMYPAYKNSPAVADLTVLGPSFADTSGSAVAFAATFPEAHRHMDAGNLHDYSGLHPESPQGGGWGISVRDAVARYRRVAGTKPLWVTENGYKMSGSVSGHPAVTERAAAKYLPRQFLTHMAHDVRRFYIYQLINDNDEDFGLLNDDGSARHQYWSVKRFLALFSDPGPPFATDSLDYRLVGDTTDVYRTLFQKRDGRFYLALWQGVASASGTRDGALRDLEPPARRLVLDLDTPITQARLYQPLDSLVPVASFGGAGPIRSIPLSVPDHLLVVELVP